MSHLTDLPPWAALLVCGLMLVGAATTLKIGRAHV